MGILFFGAQGTEREVYCSLVNKDDREERILLFGAQRRGMDGGILLFDAQRRGMEGGILLLGTQ